MALYEQWGYHGGIRADDVVFVAQYDDAPVGLVRRATEGGTTMLRGMYVAPEFRRHGVGLSLLATFADHLCGTECFCIPFAHLTGFYGRVGFALLPESEAPALLSERLRTYRGEGHQVVLMRRDPIGRGLDRAG